MIPLVTAFALGPTVDIIERQAGWCAVERAFRSAQLPLEVIDERRVFIPYASEASLIEHAARSIGEPNLGFYIGREFPFAELGVFGRYAAMAPDLAAALARAARGIRYATTSGTFDITVQGDIARISYESGIRGCLGSQHIHCGTMLLVIDLIRRFAGPGWNPIQVKLDHPKGMDAQRLEHLFETPVVFNSSRPAVVLERSVLAQKNLRPTGVHEQLTFGDLRQMVRSGPQSDLASVVQSMLRLQLLEGKIEIEQTAERLRVGPRTLQRRLSAEGITYRELVEKIRLERAAALLSETTERVSDIALTLGYSSPGHFTRAFRRWTGGTPAVYRSRNLINL